MESDQDHHPVRDPGDRGTCEIRCGSSKGKLSEEAFGNITNKERAVEKFDSPIVVMTT